MTTLTGPDEVSLKRLADLKTVNASIRGLSIEPLWDRIPPSKLNLKGIDWVIVGGESGSGDLTRPFALEWAEELREHCRKQGVAFFLKQLGRNPTRGGQLIKLKDKHGGKWDEWDESLRNREFPRAFHEYRKDKMVISDELRPVNKPKVEPEYPVTPEEKADFTRLDRIVRRGVAAFEAAGEALLEIHRGKLWRAGGHKSWEDYCRRVVGMSRGHAHRLLQASECWQQLKTSPIGDVSPVAESQIRPLLRLADKEKRLDAWKSAVGKAKGGSPTAVEVTEAVFEILNPEGSAEKPPSRSVRRIELIDRLREIVAKRSSWEALDDLIAELEALG